MGVQVRMKLEGSNPRKELTIKKEKLSPAPLKPQRLPVRAALDFPAFWTPFEITLGGILMC